MTERRRRATAPLRITAALAATGVGLVLSVVPGSAQVGRTNAFTGTASARLVGVDVDIDPTIGFDPLVDAGGSVAQAQLDSRGGSSGYAASPYPGASAITLPGTASILTQGQLAADDLPEYPLYAASSFPTSPTERISAGPYLLESTSSTTESRSSATDGATSGRARVAVDDNGRVVAEAETSVAAIEISPALTLHGVRSRAVARQDPSGDLERSSTFEVAALEVLGQRIAVTDRGLALLGQDVELGRALLDPLTVLLQALAEQGTTVEVFPAQELPDGVQSAGLRITTVQQPPPGLTSGIETAKVTVTVGGVLASVANRAIEVPAVAGVVPAIPPMAASGPVVGGALVPLPAVPAAAPPAGEVLAPTAVVASSVPSDISILGLFPVLGATALALAGTARWFSRLGRSSS